MDLVERTVTADGFSTTFEIDDYTRWRLMEGLDDIGLTLRHVDAIDRFEQTRPSVQAGDPSRQGRQLIAPSG